MAISKDYLNKISEAIIENREAYVQCDIEIGNLHTARKSLGEALVIIQENLKLRYEVLSAIASLDLIVRQTNCQKDIHRSDIDSLQQTLHELQVVSE
jgi:hypothetical protein